jgi:hypothetical protein
MQYQPCYFYIKYIGEDKANGSVWPLCQECGKNWPGAMYWTGNYGPWEVRCNNPLCPIPGGELIWDGVCDSNMP